MPIKVQRHEKTNQPFILVGGGASKRTVMSRFVLRKGELPEAIDINTARDLACRTSQARVHLLVGDVIVDIKGSRPRRTWEASAQEVLLIQKNFAETRPISVDLNSLPKSALDGTAVWDNRDGSFFVKH